MRVPVRVTIIPVIVHGLKCVVLCGCVIIVHNHDINSYNYADTPCHTHIVSLVLLYACVRYYYNIVVTSELLLDDLEYIG